MVEDLVRDWGTFLDLNLYGDAIVHFRGGKENVVRRIEVFSGDTVLGGQNAHMLNDYVAYTLSAVTNDIPAYARHLCRFLRHSQLRRSNGSILIAIKLSLPPLGGDRQNEQYD